MERLPEAYQEFVRGISAVLDDIELSSVEDMLRRLIDARMRILYFLYFTFMDYRYGQSIGKIAVKIRVQHISGRPVEIEEAAIEGFGKSSLLPLDLIIGCLLYPGKNQRLFNNLSNTVVVELKPKI